MKARVLRSVLREPLVRFAALGALLLLFSHWAGPGDESDRIVVSRGQVERLASGFSRTWQRPPTEAELAALVADYVREEAAVREAIAMGLDRADPVIRRRLRENLEFLSEDAVGSAPPTDAELRAWMDAHRDSFRTDAGTNSPLQLSSIRPQVEHAMLAERRKAEVEALYERLLAKYEVTVERPEPAPARDDVSHSEDPR